MRGCPSAVSHGGPLEGGSARVEREQLLLRAVRVDPVLGSIFFYVTL